MSIVRKAANAFKQGDYAAAEQFYLQAAERYGRELFSVNITLCERAQAPGGPARQPAATAGQGSREKAPQKKAPQIERQLQETQRLLEHYFSRCQALEYQLMDH